MLQLQQLFWINGVWLHTGKGRAFPLWEVSIILTDTPGKKSQRKPKKKTALEGISAIWNAYTKFILYAPVICATMDVLYTEKFALVLLSRCHWAAVQCAGLSLPCHGSCPAGTELPGATGGTFRCQVPPGWCVGSLQTHVSLSLLENFVDLQWGIFLSLSREN